MKKKHVEEFHDYPYLTTFFNCAFLIKIICCLLIEIVLLLFIGLCYHQLRYEHLSVSGMFGVLSDILNIMMYASPLTIMPKVLRTKSVKYMPFWLSVATFLNGVCWTIYALINSPINIYVLISGSFGTISGIVQLILYCSCNGENAENTDDVSNPTKIPF
ncbi:bidirectional sugar transporter SWEET4-like [Lotus japonicus]|uniref:bidirectional sugar transporter SWEET4-like n=1 Tax=Lotus japonicus TaxID=34305 RepID=UPI00258ECD26|nr:bidirectional sugar transporter SWEET4-like [Lotus japonicus]